MVVFELSMPNRGSWNGVWSGDGRVYARVRRNSEVPKELVGKSYFCSWDDGWTAEVSVSYVDSKTAAKIRRTSRGFSGYDWMIDSIIKYGEIKDKKDKDGAFL